MEKELLSVANALVEHRSILHGSKMCTCSDQKKITHLSTTHASAIAQLNMSLLEDLGCVAMCIIRDKNELADVLSIFPMKEPYEEQKIEESNSLRKVSENKKIFPVTLSIIEIHENE